MPRNGRPQDPLWYKDAIIYELHVRTFFDGNNDGIGDFPGLLQKLDYLQELGVTCLWILPFFPSPLRDDGYDIQDYLSVHPNYGTLDDFRAVLDAAHKRNMQVMIELVINHTSDQHAWFQRARKAPPGSPERDFYVWSDSDKKYDQVRIIFTDTEKSNWTWDPEAQAYYWHRFFSHQPDLNYDNPAVVEEVIKVMHFWLDMGVDGLRLDAIPYLVERDGTNCENLPETHALIKHLRRALDQAQGNRMILAEANQWPTDVREYFGDGDECHMAFHFPLMPRLFMGLRLEDRYPITEIMAQTPDIPDSCQWGLFLRNHDELTLEMVNDEERDYMYFAYSADPRMRINIGIRRRLAPLMENSRRRIELLNSILLSFRGTPILYYGDEIGMGDNIYLGDRNGVRTPMQWNADRNAGFSRSNPSKLYSPVIIDPIYGYEAVNVETQQADPSSLLHWTRNMIALRKLFRVFGRGSLEFLDPSNRKILAYTRIDGDERILCVANLSRFAQPVQLDLSEFAGMVPVEMIGVVDFPEIRKEPYPLTLGPYGYFWFELQPSRRALEPEPESAPAEDTGFAYAKTWADVFSGISLDVMEQDYLPKFIQKQRWFGSKTKTITRATVKDWAAIDDTTSVIAFTEVSYSDGGAETYVVPLKWDAAEAAQALRESSPTAILTQWTSDNGEQVIYDATFDSETCYQLLRQIEKNRETPATRGKLAGAAGAAFRALRGTSRSRSLTPKRSTAEQSNTSIRYGARMIMKLFRKPEPGPNPDLEITRYLTEDRHVECVPRFGGSIDYRPAEGEPLTIALIQEMVQNQGDGWEWTLESLARYYEDCLAREAPPAEDDPELVKEVMAIYLDAAQTLAYRTADVHLALASASDNPAMRPEPLTHGDLLELAAALEGHADEVLDKLKQHLSTVPDELVEMTGQVLGRRRSLLARIQAVQSITGESLKTRVHGDYHLGQVLRVENDFVLLDFEGEPARSLAERRQKHPPLKDVAGMLRSFSYAAQAAYLNHTARRPHDAEKLAPWAALWERSAAGVFLRTYREAIASAPIVPADEQEFRRLLDAYVLDKALYELNYELNHRPSWVRIPLMGILALYGL